VAEAETVWSEREFTEHDFRDEDLSRLRTERGSAFRNPPQAGGAPSTFRRTTLWTTAALRGARIDIEQALAFAAAHGLDVHGE
jgi:hypothetical protein